MRESTTGKLKVLWAVDGSSHTAHSAALLKELILPVTAKLTVLTVAPHSMLTGARPDPSFLTKITQTARGHALAEAKEIAEKAKIAAKPPELVAVETISRWGHPIEEILRAANELNSDLILMAAQGHSNLRLIVLGSVAQGVLQHAICPVLVARAPTESVDRVLVGYDGSAVARKAVRFLGGLTASEDVQFLLVNVVEPFTLPAGTPLSYRRMAIKEAHEINDHRRDLAQRSLEAAAKLLSAAGRRITTRVASGHAAQTLDDIARKEQADLLVVGSQRPATQRHYLTGSTADQLARHSHTSVLIVR